MQKALHARSHLYSIALRHKQQQVLMADPNWNKGFYYNLIPPHIGMKLAREIVTVSYQSGPEMGITLWKKETNKRTNSCIISWLSNRDLFRSPRRENLFAIWSKFITLYIKTMDLFDMSASALEKLIHQRFANSNRNHMMVHVTLPTTNTSRFHKPQTDKRKHICN